MLTQEELKENEIAMGDGRKLVYVQGPAITGGAPSVTDAGAVGYALKRMEDHAEASGPSRSTNPKPRQQAEGYRISDLIPQSMLDASLEEARRDVIARQQAESRLIRQGAADARPKK